MTKQEKLEQLRQALKGVALLMTEAVRNVYKSEMLPIIESTTEYKMKMKSDVNDDWCEITFDLGDWNKEWGLDFTIRLNHNKLMEITHGWLTYTTLEQRKYLIERDKIVGKLWDKEEEIKAVFINAKNARDEMFDTYNALEREIWAIEDEIAQEERKQYLGMLTIGSKWVYKWEQNSEYKRPMTIVKITNKLVFYTRAYSPFSTNNSNRMKITDIVRNLKNGEIVKYEEEQPQASE